MALKYVWLDYTTETLDSASLILRFRAGPRAVAVVNYKTINVGLDLNLNKLNGDCGFYCRAHSVQKLNQLNWRRREIHQDKDLDKMLYLYLYSKYLDICTFLSVF